MAKKAQTKAAAPKARPKAPAAKKPATASAPAARAAASKYDQSGAPWWKKFRPTESDASPSKR